MKFTFNDFLDATTYCIKVEKNPEIIHRRWFLRKLREYIADFISEMEFNDYDDIDNFLNSIDKTGAFEILEESKEELMQTVKSYGDINKGLDWLWEIFGINA